MNWWALSPRQDCIGGKGRRNARREKQLSGSAPAFLATVLVKEDGSPLNDEDLVSPQLSESQKQDAEHRTSVSAMVVHEAIRRDGDEELQRPASALGWSGLAAGLSMGFSFVAEGLLRAHLPESQWRPLLVNLGYPLGFLIVIIGRQQLFTENTLTAIIPLLARRKLTTLVSVIRLWAIVLAANLVGAHLFALVIARAPVLKPEVQQAMAELATEAANVSFWTALIRGIFAGWLIAMVVWMNAATEAGRFPIIVTLTYVVGLAGLTHIVAGSVEVLYLVMRGEKSWFSFAAGYMVPALIGNIIGGVSLVSAVNHAQVVGGITAKKESRLA
ncbi:MAG: formate-nitrite transporter family protein [Bryobacterales bacterium]|jgi:formate/nitrite transporter FocA (FNT family)|nr:formate-nitrite transporter family protein [Bryobacterales bacterium]